MYNKKTIKNILIATDFSQSSDFAIVRGMEIAEKFNAKITILHVIQETKMDNFIDGILKKMGPHGLWLTLEEYKQTLLQEQIQRLIPHNLNINYVLIPKGKPSVKIIQYAKKNKIDLIIIGAHGEYSIRDTFLGTTAEYIAQHTRCPVLVVKNKPKNHYKKILIPTDFSRASKNALELAVKLFTNSNLRVFHAGDYEYKFILKLKEWQLRKNQLQKLKKTIFYYLENQMKKFIKGYHKKLNKHLYITLGYPGPTIVNETKKLKQDLVVMSTQSHGKFHYLYIGSVANWVMKEGVSDVLLVPHHKR